MQKPKWSILIITLFLLIITGLIGLIVMIYIKSMLAFTNTFHDYQQAFYLANAGLELQLVKAKNHGFGFEDAQWSGSTTVTKNLNCIADTCYFASDLKTHSAIVGQKEQITSDIIECNENVGYITNSNKLISSLFFFKDDQSNAESEWKLISSKTYKTLTSYEYITLHTYGLKTYKIALQATNKEWEPSQYDKIIEINSQDTIRLIDYSDFFTKALWDPEIQQIRIKVINDLKYEGSVCFSYQGNVKLPWFHEVIDSIGAYHNTQVRLQAIQTNIPWDEQDLAGGNI